MRHDRAVVLGSLGFVIIIAWVYLLLGAGVGMEMMDMGGGQMMAMAPEWTLAYGLVVFLMWAVMMVAMMLPSAAPVTPGGEHREEAPRGGRCPGHPRAVRLRLSRSVVRLRCGGGDPAVLQFDALGMLSETMALASTVLAGSVLIAAGLAINGPR